MSKKISNSMEWGGNSLEYVSSHQTALEKFISNVSTLYRVLAWEGCPIVISEQGQEALQTTRKLVSQAQQLMSS